MTNVGYLSVMSKEEINLSHAVAVVSLYDEHYSLKELFFFGELVFMWFLFFFVIETELYIWKRGTQTVKYK